jgi:thiol-disulfide isomerase/thioredoxin
MKLVATRAARQRSAVRRPTLGGFIVLSSAVLSACLLLGACGKEEASHDAPSPVAPPGRVDLVRVPATTEPLPHLFQRELARARADGRDLVIYVGATWCEPCRYFHDAVDRGELDATFPSLRLLELDLDRDRTRLDQAGCASNVIPLFSRPTEAGTCDPNHRVMGSIKGPGAVDNLVPRLKKMLAPG